MEKVRKAFVEVALKTYLGQVHNCLEHDHCIRMEVAQDEVGGLAYFKVLENDHTDPFELCQCVVGK